MKVRFKGKDPRAGRVINLTPAAAKRYIDAGLGDEVKDAQPRTAAAEEAAPEARGEPAAEHHQATHRKTGRRG